MSFRIMDRSEVETLLRIGRDLHEGRTDVPDEIKELRERIKKAIENAELFVALFRVVDMTMVHTVVEMKLELDALYGDWIVAENHKLH